MADGELATGDGPAQGSGIGPGLMRYSCQVVVAVPRADVIRLMTDASRASEWQAGLREYRAVQGQPGRDGSVSELHFDGMPGGGVMVEKVERLTDDALDAVYLLGPVRNVMHSSFTDTRLDDGTVATRWLAEHIFHLPPMMQQQLGTTGEAAFRENTQRSMEGFKTWCENSWRDEGGQA